jgi:hypothetical protein
MGRILLALLLALLVTASPALAGKPDHAGGGNSGKSKGKSSKGGGPPSSKGNASAKSGGGGGGPGPSHGDGFSSAQRSSYWDWYDDEYHHGCPPGLAKKNNGCLPPGIAKKRYTIGYPLPHGVVLGPLPSALAILLGAPPAGYRYGILDGDVVKLAIGTALVVDAIEGLANR